MKLAKIAIPHLLAVLIIAQILLPFNHLNPFFGAAAEAVEEAILNALTAAETMSGLAGHTAYALSIDELKRIMRQSRAV